jgi:hypothetical protein
VVAPTDATDERELLVPLTKRALRAVALSGTRTEGAAFIVVVLILYGRLKGEENKGEMRVKILQ